MSRGLGRVEKQILDALARKALSWGTDVPVSCHELRGKQYGLDVSSTWPLRRAMRSLAQKEWVSPWWVQESVQYLRVPPKDSARIRLSGFAVAGDQLVDPVTGAQLEFSTERKVLAATFSHEGPHPMIERLLPPYFREQFEQALKGRLASRKAGPDGVVYFHPSNLMLDRKRDEFLWADSMGSNVPVEVAYFRWEAGQREGGVTLDSKR